MRYFLVVLFHSALCQNILTEEMEDNPLSYDLEQELVRLDRVLQMEVQLGSPLRYEKLASIQLESNFYQVDDAKAIQKPPTDNLKLVERLEKIEKNWVKDLEKQLAKFTLKYDNLTEKFAAMEKKVEECHWIINASGNFKKIGSKYYLIEQVNTLSWQNALGKCRELDGKLASLQNEEEWRALKYHLEFYKSYWVDVNDINEEGRYVSGTSGQKAPFLKWEAGEPNHLNSQRGKENCVELRRDYNHYMNDIHCSEENYYICELKTHF